MNEYGHWSTIKYYDFLHTSDSKFILDRDGENTNKIYGLDNLTKNKPGEVAQQPERYLLRYLRAYPYFSRLEFFERRGFRDLPAYADPSELVIDR